MNANMRYVTDETQVIVREMWNNGFDRADIMLALLAAGYSYVGSIALIRSLPGNGNVTSITCID